MASEKKIEILVITHGWVIVGVVTDDGRESGEAEIAYVLLDGVRANGESWFLARCLDALRAEGWAGVVSLSDPTPRTSASGAVVFGGHVGTIYQASNAVYTGRASPQTLRLLPDGSVFSNRAASKIRNGERGWRYAVEQLVAHGAPEPRGDLHAWLREVVPVLTRPLRHRGNHRYLFPLTRAAKRVVPASLPYPKLGIRPANGNHCEGAELELRARRLRARADEMEGEG